jgi:pimeloyl-ACP methyl ester carboxylesterase
MHSSFSSRRPRFPWLPVLLATGATLALGAAAAQQRTRKADRLHPPRGRFIEVDGVALHYLEQGKDDGPPLVLLHDSGVTSEDFDISGLMRRAAERYRVIAFDRPGYGHSETAPDARGDARRQAELIAAALARIGAERPVVAGHGWGALAALALALDHPHAACSLVLLSGPWAPRPGLGLAWRAAAALPGIGALMRRVVTPWVQRAVWPLTQRRLFAPAPVSGPFRWRVEPWLTLRPETLHAVAAEAAQLRQTVRALRLRGASLKVPVVIVADDGDRAARGLHSSLPGSRLQAIEGAGHMAHHVATARVLDAIDEAAALMRLHVSPARAPGTPLAAVASSDAPRRPA